MDLSSLLFLGGVGIAILAVAYWAFSENFKKLVAAHETQRDKNRAEVDTGVKNMLNDSREAVSKLMSEMREQLQYHQREMGELKTQGATIRQHLDQVNQATRELHISTEGLKGLLSNNRLKGEWGEQVAEDLLIGAGFVREVNYTKQQSTLEGRPDFTILLPDGKKLNVDVKFNFEDLISYQNAKSEADRRQALQSFEKAVKLQAKSITSRDYISEETLDFVVMFIPNEMIFSFIYEKLPGVNQYCNQRGVVLAGPYGFTALARLVLQGYRNFRYEQGLQEILGYINKFQIEYDKFGTEMQKLGQQIETVQKTFVKVEGTRGRQLTRIVDKISEHTPAKLPETEATLSIPEQEPELVLSDISKDHN